MNKYYMSVKRLIVLYVLLTVFPLGPEAPAAP